RRARARVRLLLALDRPGPGHQAVRDRSRGGRAARRDADPGAARALDHAAAGAGELVVPGARAPSAARAGCRAGVKPLPPRLGRVATVHSPEVLIVMAPGASAGEVDHVVARM